jgi:hypothetical protein
MAAHPARDARQLSGFYPNHIHRCQAGGIGVCCGNRKSTGFVWNPFSEPKGDRGMQNQDCAGLTRRLLLLAAIAGLILLSAAGGWAAPINSSEPGKTSPTHGVNALAEDPSEPTAPSQDELPVAVPLDRCTDSARRVVPGGSAGSGGRRGNVLTSADSCGVSGGAAGFVNVEATGPQYFIPVPDAEGMKDGRVRRVPGRDRGCGRCVRGGLRRGRVPGASERGGVPGVARARGRSRWSRSTRRSSCRRRSVVRRCSARRTRFGRTRCAHAFAGESTAAVAEAIRGLAGT